MSGYSVAAIVRCYKITGYLERVLKNLSDIDLIIVANGPYPGVPREEDNTLEIVRKLKQKNILVYLHDGKEQKDVFNECLSLLANYDFVLINDADEFLLREDRKNILDKMVDRGVDADVGICPVIDYSPDGKRYPLRDHMPIVAVRPYVKFVGNRSVFYGGGVVGHFYLHHFGYALKKDMEWKKKNIWYPSESFDEIVKNPTESYHKPEELKKVLNE